MGLLAGLGLGSPGNGQPVPDSTDPALLLTRAQAAPDGPIRRRLARETLRALAGAEPARPWLEAHAWALFGQPDRGLELVAALGTPPESETAAPDALAALAQAFLDRGDARAAERALHLLPSRHHPALQRLRAGVEAARGLELLGRGRQEEALPLLIEALRGGNREPRLVRGLYDALRVLDRGGRLVQAIPGFQALAEALPEEAWTALDLAVALRRAGRYAEAQHALAAGAARHPGNLEFPNEQGLVEKARCRWARAEEHFRAAVALESAAGVEGPARANLGLLLLDRDRPAEALEVLGPLLSRQEAGTLGPLLWLRAALRPEPSPL